MARCHHVVDGPLGPDGRLTAREHFVVDGDDQAGRIDLGQIVAADRDVVLLEEGCDPDGSGEPDDLVLGGIHVEIVYTATIYVKSL